MCSDASRPLRLRSSSSRAATRLALAVLAAGIVGIRARVVLCAEPTAVLRAGGPVHALAWSSDGTLLAAASGREYASAGPPERGQPGTCDISLWRLPGAGLERRLRLRGGKVWTLAFAPDGALLAGSRSESFRWDFARDSATPLVEATDAEGWPLAVSPDARWMTREEASGAWLWDLRTRCRVLQLVSRQAGTLETCFSRDSARLAVGSSAGIRLWTRDAAPDHPSAPFTLRRELPLSTVITCLGFSPDAATLAIGGDRGEVKLQDLETGRSRTFTPDRFRAVTSLAFSPGGRTLAIGTAAHEDQAEVQLWSLFPHRLTHRFLGHQANVTALAFSPASRLLASASNDHTVCLWALGVGE